LGDEHPLDLRFKVMIYRDLEKAFRGGRDARRM
jgi:hypothetical protein